MSKIWTAQRMIQQVGVTLPESPPDNQHLLHVAFKKVFITTTIEQVIRSNKLLKMHFPIYISKLFLYNVKYFIFRRSREVNLVVRTPPTVI